MFSQYRSASEPQYIEASTIAANSTPNPIMRIGLWPRSIRPIFLSQPNVARRETHRSLDRKACPDLQFNASGAGGKNCCSVSNPERPGWHSRFVTVKGRQCRSLISRGWELATAPPTGELRLRLSASHLADTWPRFNFTRRSSKMVVAGKVPLIAG